MSTIDLLQDDLLMIHDDEQFFEDVKEKLAEIIITEGFYSKTEPYFGLKLQYAPKTIRYLMTLIDKCIQKNTNSLVALRHNNPDDLQAAHLYERTIQKLSLIIDRLVLDEYKYEPSFSYLDDLLELTLSTDTLLSLLQLVSKLSESSSGMWSQVAGLYYFIEPCTFLTDYFNLDLKALYEEIIAANTQINDPKDLFEALEKMLTAIFRGRERLLDDIRAYYLTKGANSRETFITELTEDICKKYGLSRTANRLEYYKVLGAINLASHLLTPKFNEQLLPLIMLARGVSSNFILFSS